MRVPTRKPGKYTGKKPDPFVTRYKYHELQAKLDRLKRFSQPHAIKEVKTLALMGDFSDNAAYSIAKGRLRGINQRILDIEDHLKRAIIIEERKNSDVITLGCMVTVEVNGKQKKFQILGSSETDPNKNIISHNSPIGKALLGHRVGDIVVVQLSSKKLNYKIIKIK